MSPLGQQVGRRYGYAAPGGDEEPPQRSEPARRSHARLGRPPAFLTMEKRLALWALAVERRELIHYTKNCVTLGKDTFSFPRRKKRSQVVL